MRPHRILPAAARVTVFGERPQWMTAAKCRVGDPDAWYPADSIANSPNYARDVCGGCPVIPDCLEYALKHRDDWGIWGATTVRERRRMLKRRAA